MKSKKELNALKEEVETVSNKLADLSDDEIAQVVGGGGYGRLIIFTAGDGSEQQITLHVGADSNQADPLISESTDDKNRYKYLRTQKTDTVGVFCVPLK